MGAAFLREMNWLGSARTRGYLVVLAVLNCLILAWLVAASRNGVDAHGFLLGSDFISFWTAGIMLQQHGNPYDGAAHIAAQRAFLASQDGYTAFFYPPNFLPLCWPLGLMGYFPALGAWLVATGGCYLLAVRSWLQDVAVPAPLWLLFLAFPAVPIVITHGQTAFLVAALLGAGGMLVSRRPWLAGVALGLATIKPQFGLLFPLALLLSRQWRTIISAVLTAAALTAVSIMQFGLKDALGWFDASARAEEAMAAGAVGFAKMMSLFAALRLHEVSVSASYAVQALVSLAVVLAIAWLSWRRGWSLGLSSAVLSGAPLVTPFVLDYDMVLLAFPLLWLVHEGLRDGFRPWEKCAAALAFIAPAFARPMAMNLGLPIMPLVLSLLFIVIVRRASFSRP